MFSLYLIFRFMMEFQEVSAHPAQRAAFDGPLDNTEENSMNCQSADALDMEHESSAGEMATKVTWTPTDHLRSLLSAGEGGVEAGNARAGGVAQDMKDQDDELRALGISVVDQLSLERDVEAAVSCQSH